MKTKPHHSVGLAALTYALVLLSGDVTGQSGTSTESCIPSRIGNGHCDRSQNTKACGRCRVLNEKEGGGTRQALFWAVIDWQLTFCPKFALFFVLDLGET